MSKKTSRLVEAPAIGAIERFVVHLLESDLSAYEISFGLAAVATDLGLQMAPSAEQALEVVAEAIRAAVANRASTDSTIVALGEVDTVETDAIFIGSDVSGWTVH